jgi:cytochrome P450
LLGRAQGADSGGARLPDAAMIAPLPPDASGLPLIGNLFSFMTDPLGFLCATREKHGDVARVAVGPMKFVLLSHPDLVEDVLVTRNKLWLKDRFTHTTFRPVFGDGLLASEGDFWRRQRRLAQPAFHRDRIAAYADIMVSDAAQLVAHWQDGETREVHKDMMRLTLEIVAQTLFGAEVGTQADEVGHALEVLLDIAADPLYLALPFMRNLPLPGKRRFDAAVARLDRIIYGIIEDRRKRGTQTADLLSMLLHAEDEDGSRMSDQQLRDEVLTLFLAGHETTALALSWSWWMLSQHPAVDAKLAEETQRVLGDRRATLADLPKLKYTANVIAEVLRMYPPAWMLGREAREDIVVGGYLVRAGEQVWMPPWLLQRDPRWFDHPHEFRPERWENDFAKTLHKYVYYPFGGGPRICIGQAFAQMEAVLLLATLARSFRVDIPAQPPVLPEPTVTLRPKGGVRGRLVRRA